MGRDDYQLATSTLQCIVGLSQKLQCATPLLTQPRCVVSHEHKSSTTFDALGSSVNF